MIGEPPLYGSFHATSSLKPPFGVTSGAFGALGSSCTVAPNDDNDHGDSPIRLNAFNWNSYRMPCVKPVTVTLRFVPVTGNINPRALRHSIAQLVARDR